MKPIRFFTSLLLLAALLLPTAQLALAWPDQPPDKAFISGPGIVGQKEITDQAALKALRLGGVEDFAGGPVAEPTTGDRYTLTRYFYGGEFNFGTLTYALTPGGSYVRFDDGPDLSGDHTQFNGKWFRATPEGQTIMKQILESIGPSLIANNAPPVAVDTRPLTPGQPLIWVAVLVGALGLSGGALALKLRLSKS